MAGSEHQEDRVDQARGRETAAPCQSDAHAMAYDLSIGGADCTTVSGALRPFAVRLPLIPMVTFRQCCRNAGTAPKLVVGPSAGSILVKDPDSDWSPQEISLCWGFRILFTSRLLKNTVAEIPISASGHVTEIITC